MCVMCLGTLMLPYVVKQAEDTLKVVLSVYHMGLGSKLRTGRTAGQVRKRRDNIFNRRSRGRWAKAIKPY